MSVIILNGDWCVRLICSTWTATLGEYLWAALLAETCNCSKTYKAVRVGDLSAEINHTHRWNGIITHPPECFVHLHSHPAGLLHVRLGWDGNFWNAVWSLSAITQREGDICWLAASKVTLSNAYWRGESKGVDWPWHRQKWKPYLISAL